MFTDAYDVLIYDDASNIVEAFKKFDANVVFGAEYFCYPNTSFRHEFPAIKSGRSFLIILEFQFLELSLAFT